MGFMPELITSEQLATLLGVDRSTVLRRVRHGDIVPAYSGPGRTGVYLFDVSTLELPEQVAE